MKPGRKNRTKPGERYGIKAWIAPARLVKIAAERTEGMVGFFISEARRGQHWLDDLDNLVRSAYMQGVNDIIDATITQLNITSRKEQQTDE